MAKAPTVKFVSPKVIARYPKLIEADTKGEYADGKWKTDGVFLSEQDLKEFKSKAIEAAKQLLPNVKSPKLPFKVVTDKNTGEELEVFATKTSRKPAIFDAKAQPAAPKSIGGGSIIKLSGAFAAYEKGPNRGITAYLNSVQVIDLKAGYVSGSEFEVEDGYDASENGDTADFTDETTSGDVMEL